MCSLLKLYLKVICLANLTFCPVQQTDLVRINYIFFFLAVLGNKLEDKMLSNFISALRTHFSLNDEWDVVLGYLQSFTQLPRFSFVVIMLDNESKKGNFILKWQFLTLCYEEKPEIPYVSVTELEVLLTEAANMRLQVSQLLQPYNIKLGVPNLDEWPHSGAMLDLSD